MNPTMQTLSNATKSAKTTVARKSHKPRTWTDLATVISIVLTVLAALPYELGAIATVVPPDWKPKIALIGVIAATTLGALRPYLPSPNAPEPEKK